MGEGQGGGGGGSGVVGVRWRRLEDSGGWIDVSAISAMVGLGGGREYTPTLWATERRSLVHHLSSICPPLFVQLSSSN